MLAALGANLGIAVTKLVAFAITGSASMLAESVHSLADSGNQALLLVGRRRARQEQTEEHPFGFGRERYFYAFIVAVVLFTVGAVFSLYEGVHKIISPEKIHSPVVAFVVLAKWRWSRSRIGGLFVALMAASLCTTLFLGFSHDRIYYGTETRSFELLAGALLAVVIYSRRVTGRLIPVENAPVGPGEMPAVVVDISAARALGYQPTMDLDTGLATVWPEFDPKDVTA